MRLGASRLTVSCTAPILVGLLLFGLVDGHPTVVDRPGSGSNESSAAKTQTESDPKSENGNQTEPKTEKSSAQDSTGWKSFLPESGLDGWVVTDFYKHGEVKRDGDLLIFDEGQPLTGITYDSKVKFPTSNFEIELQARRTKGNDFLCGLTFPVGKGFCSFIAGGWGGGLVGLSSIDGSDASENATSTYHDFKNDQWYRFRVSVDDELIRCWIDDDQIVTQERENHEFTTRIEVYASQPLGFCVFRSRVEVKNFRWRSLDSEHSRDDSKTPADGNGGSNK